ncbi:PPK2 family polyphosphate kinase [Arthrobacter sp. UM1]|uniref:PPK2 family polyphosphate kinase n=1 Tax=Arthrobacter sp. UM1 TaxID=2766776 RepID=UPI001CF67EC0|nr:PPK2 family polyphosphate kinase [Arthrobacter sp. UM1]
MTAGPLNLATVDPRSTPGFDKGKKKAAKALEKGALELSDLQERLFAASRDDDDAPAVLLVLQGMDTSGKGGIVRHVVGAVDPQGVEHTSFKAPTDEEKKHDFLWRIEKHVPGAGMICVFDRSHYEDVLIHRVHGWADEPELERRYAAIREFEENLASRGVRVVKVMLHISQTEQGERLLERLDRPDKFWKYNPGDVTERKLWDDYQDAYEKAVSETSTEAAPWHIVPADRKWYARLAVQTILLEALRDIDPQWPAASFNRGAERARLAATL